MKQNRLFTGVDRLANHMIGRHRRRRARFRDWQEAADRIHARSLEMRTWTDRELRERLDSQRQVFRRRAKGYESGLEEAYALIVESSSRVLGMRPFPVQVLGALVLFHGGLAEMATGEGKSLTAVLPAVVSAWSAEACHIVTSNDYLAERDARELAPLYAFCHATVGSVLGPMPQHLRRENYRCDVVYVTSKELLADYLRDLIVLGGCLAPGRQHLKHMCGAKGQRLSRGVMRGLHTVFVDEADSVLIDEAVTPLIISNPQANPTFVEACGAAARIARNLARGRDYRVDDAFREVSLTEEGGRRVETLSQDLPALWQSRRRREELVSQALTAREYFHNGQQYVVEDDKVTIVDEFTGRTMKHRTWRQGLHQMVEAHEGVPLTDPSETIARMSFQRFFRQFRKIGGLTGTANESSEEFWQTYGLPVFTVPTNRPCRRVEFETRPCLTPEERWRAISDEVSHCLGTGRPVLIGTRSVAASEQLARHFDARGLRYNLLNAARHQEEAEIVAAAGQQGMVTIATNMAGRGTDIKLGPGVAELGGLHVIVSERHESRRIDRQLAGRAARQGDPGSFRFYVTPEDDLLIRHGTGTLDRVSQKIKPSSSASRIVRRIERAQSRAQSDASQQRKSVLKNDDWLTEALSFSPSVDDPG